MLCPISGTHSRSSRLLRGYVALLLQLRRLQRTRLVCTPGWLHFTPTSVLAVSPWPWQLQYPGLSTVTEVLPSPVAFLKDGWTCRMFPSLDHAWWLIQSCLSKISIKWRVFYIAKFGCQLEAACAPPPHSTRQEILCADPGFIPKGLVSMMLVSF